MRISSIVVFLTLFSFVTYAQKNEVIKPTDSGMSLFEDSGVEHISIVISSSESLTIQLKCKSDDEKAFVVTGELLDSRKKKLAAFSCVPKDLSVGSESVDLEFKVSDNKSSMTTLKSHYIKIKMSEKEDDDSLLGGLEDLFGGSDDDPIGDMFGKKYIFKYTKDWRLKGNKSMVIKIPLNPIGEAKNLK